MLYMYILHYNCYCSSFLVFSILPGKGHCYNYTDVVGKMKSYFNESVIAGEWSVNQVDASRVTRPGRYMHCNCLYIGVLTFIFHLNRFGSSQGGGEGSQYTCTRQIFLALSRNHFRKITSQLLFAIFS